MKGHGEKLSRTKEKAIAALLTAPSVIKAAKEAEISEGTMWRWLRDEGFKKAYAAARRELVHHAIVVVQKRMTKAIDVLAAIMEDQDAPASSRVSAAKTILDVGLRATETEDMEARITRLEALANG